MENTFEGWDTGGEDFFAEVDGATSEQNADPIIPSNRAEEEKDPGTTEEEGAQKEEDLFNTPIVNQEPSEQEEDDEEEQEDSKEKTLDNVSVINDLKRRGLINFELEEDEELTEDLAGDLLEDSYEKAIDEKIKEKLQGLPDHSKNLMEYMLKGGNPKDFISSNNTSLSEDLDMDKESDQELVMIDKLKREGNDEEFIKSQIEFLKDSGNLKRQASREFEGFVENKKATDKANLKRIEDNKIAAREAERKSKRELEEFIGKEDNLEGLSIPTRLKKELPSYINDKSVLLNNGTSITEMQEELFYNIPKNKKAMVQLASLLKNRNEDGTFNLDNIARKEETKITKKVKQEIRRAGNDVPGSSGGGGASKKSLAELFS